MGSATASPETSPTRAEKTRKSSTSDVHVFSLTGDEQSSVIDNAYNSFDDKEDNQNPGIVRKGRGTFRGPSNDTQQDQGSRAPRGRDFDATTLRQYPPKSGEKSQNRHTRKKSKSGKRQGSDGGQAGSESEESGSDANITEDINKLAASLESASIGENEKESNSPIQQNNQFTSPASQDRQTQQTVEEWERVPKSEINNRETTVFGQLDQSDQKQKVDGSRPFKRGHKKSKSSKIEFNFDPDAYDGSTRILDIFDFPASFKNHDLHEIFQEYENMRGGYRIKWMDDTRALIIFEHPATARKAYVDNVSSQLAQIKPYDGPTDFLQKNPNNAAQPRARPATTDVVAKRLVHGALGVRVQRSPEQRQADRQVLQSARDQRDQRRSDALRRSQELDAAFNE